MLTNILVLWVCSILGIWRWDCYPDVSSSNLELNYSLSSQIIGSNLWIHPQCAISNTLSTPEETRNHNQEHLLLNLGEVVVPCHPNTVVMESGGLKDHYPEPHKSLEASLWPIRPCLKRNQNKQTDENRCLNGDRFSIIRRLLFLYASTAHWMTLSTDMYSIPGLKAEV